MPLIKSVIKSVAKSVLIPLGLIAVAAAADAGLCKNVLESGHNTATTIISNDQMENIIKTIKSFEDLRLLLKEASETIQNDIKNKKEGILECY